MRFRVQVVSETSAGELVEEVACLTREDERLADVGISLAEAKTMLSGIQAHVVTGQVNEYLERCQECPDCGCPLLHKGRHQIKYRTLFGDILLDSPRFFLCDCRPHERQTFSPLAGLLPERSSPERLYLETKWAALVSYETAAKLLADVLPVDEGATSVRNHARKVAIRSEAALGEEQVMFVDGCPREWAALPRPPGPLTVGIDGGYIRRWDDKKTHFEAIVGKARPEEGPGKCFGFVQTYDQKPKRRLFEMLKSQGLQMNQQVVFQSDGGDDVRDLQLYLCPESEHYLDWFHVTMRLTVLGQHAKGIEDPRQREESLTVVERIKYLLWHGNVHRALEELEDLTYSLDGEEPPGPAAKKLLRAANEFRIYIGANRHFIPNYGERWRNQEAIATASWNRR
jgi:hypothetical protein